MNELGGGERSNDAQFVGCVLVGISVARHAVSNHPARTCGGPDGRCVVSALVIAIVVAVEEGVGALGGEGVRSAGDSPTGRLRSDARAEIDIVRVIVALVETVSGTGEVDVGRSNGDVVDGLRARDSLLGTVVQSNHACLLIVAALVIAILAAREIRGGAEGGDRFGVEGAGRHAVGAVGEVP